MQKFSQLIYLIIFLVLMASSCMARTIVNQAGIDDRLHHFINKRQSNRRGDCVYGLDYNRSCFFDCFGGIPFGTSDLCRYLCRTRTCMSYAFIVCSLVM
ncbi:unnamed protein product [Rotaria socialis]|uniref:Uncharacterized protein n=1 Tax=Rotaria socialis TaxID=392032 RepID=A0A818CPC0_9BILA|nr:unnamed protein product [Rotaria socialis]CAF3531392.1 unnamed protein product [Rotaria socialis]CAF4551279.1 unnamed protein product [Rotaria socialis]